jgi:hypothetical protein
MKLWFTRCGLKHKPEAQAKDRPSLAPQPCVLLKAAQPMQNDDEAPLSPVLGGEGLGVRGRSIGRSGPLTPTLSPEYRGEGESKCAALVAQSLVVPNAQNVSNCQRAAFLLLILTSFANATPSRAEDKPSAWLADYDQARKVARENGKPLLVVFRCEY